jgi:hypothetical protein
MGQAVEVYNKIKLKHDSEEMNRWFLRRNGQLKRKKWAGNSEYFFNVLP